MSSIFGPKISNRGSGTKEDTGLIFYLDASNKQCAPRGGGDLVDLISGKSARLYNGAVWQNRNGGAIYFDGSNDRLEVSGMDDFGVLNDITIEIIAEANQGTAGILFDCQDGRGAGSALGIEISGKDFVWGDTLPSANTAIYHSHHGSLPSLLTAGVFTLTFTVDNGGKCAMYYNSTLVNKASSFGSNFRQLSANSGYPLTFFSNVGGGSEHTSGWLYSFKVYNKIVPLKEITVNTRSVKKKYKLTDRIL